MRKHLSVFREARALHANRQILLSWVAPFRKGFRLVSNRGAVKRNTFLPISCKVEDSAILFPLGDERQMVTSV